MGSTGQQEESAGWKDLQAVGTATTPPSTSEGGGPGAAPAVLQEERQAGEGERGAISRTEKGSPQSKGKIATAVKEVTITKTTAETTAITRITTAEAKKKSGNRHAAAATGKQAG